MIDVISLKEAQSRVFKNINFLQTERVKIEDSLNRVLSIDVFSNESLPQFKRSIVDGYAVKSINCVGISQSVPGLFNFKGEVLMGKESNFLLSDNDCVYVPTGGEVPEDFDAVAMIENCKKIDNEVLVFSPLKKNENIINVGEDIKEKSCVLKAGTVINAYNIGLLAGLGIKEIEVFKKFNYSIISTGDEIVPIDERISKCNIRDINSYSIEASLTMFGNCINKYLLKDDIDILVKTIKEASNCSDLIFLSGGSSVGKKDYTLDAISSISSNVLFHGVSIKPGKPTMASVLNNTMIIGLPGHPMAALMSLDLIFVESLKKKMNICLDNIVYAKMNVNFPSSPGRTTIMPLKLTRDKETLLAEPLFYKSGLINILNKADGYTVINESEEGINNNEIIEVRKI